MPYSYLGEPGYNSLNAFSTPSDVSDEDRRRKYINRRFMGRQDIDTTRQIDGDNDFDFSQDVEFN